MVRTIDSTTARDQLEHLIDQAHDRGDSVIIERNGQPAAALVPVDVLERQRQARSDVLQAIRKYQAGVKTDLSDPEIEQLIDREAAAARQEKRGRHKQSSQPKDECSPPRE